MKQNLSVKLTFRSGQLPWSLIFPACAAFLFNQVGAIIEIVRGSRWLAPYSSACPLSAASWPKLPQCHAFGISQYIAECCGRCKQTFSTVAANQYLNIADRIDFPTERVSK